MCVIVLVMGPEGAIRSAVGELELKVHMKLI